MAIGKVEQLRVYEESFEAAMRILVHSKRWPKGERYALTDQIRRSSRSVCANIREAWRKRRYPKHFVSKLSDADAEAAETRTWLQFAVRCGYIDESVFEPLDAAYDKICGGLVTMMNAPDKGCGPANRVREDGPDYRPGL